MKEIASSIRPLFSLLNSPLEHRRSQGGRKGHAPPKFLEVVVIFCFGRRCFKQNSVIRLKSNICPPKVYSLATPLHLILLINNYSPHVRQARNMWRVVTWKQVRASCNHRKNMKAKPSRLIPWNCRKPRAFICTSLKKLETQLQFSSSNIHHFALEKQILRLQIRFKKDYSSSLKSTGKMWEQTGTRWFLEGC